MKLPASWPGELVRWDRLNTHVPLAAGQTDGLG